MQLSRCGADAVYPAPSTDLHAGDLLRPFDSRHRHSGDPEVHGAKEIPIGEIERLPIRTAEGDVGCLRLAVDDTPQLLALRIQNPDATRAATIDVPSTVHLHPVRDTGFGTAEICEHAICLPGQRTIWRHIERACVPVSPVGRLLEFHRPLTGRVFHSPVAIDVAEQKVGALLPPQRAFSRAVVAADAVGKLTDWLAGADDLVKFRLELFDPFHTLCGCDTAEAGAEGGATGRC